MSLPYAYYVISRDVGPQWRQLKEKNCEKQGNSMPKFNDKLLDELLEDYDYRT